MIVGELENTKPIIAMVDGLNKNNIRFIIDKYINMTDGKWFKQPSDISNCFRTICKRCKCKVSIVDQIEYNIDDSKIELYTEYINAWYDFNCIIRVSRSISGFYKSEAIYVYQPSEHVSFIKSFAINFVEAERMGIK